MLQACATWFTFKVTTASKSHALLISQLHACCSSLACCVTTGKALEAVSQLMPGHFWTSNNWTDSLLTHSCSSQITAEYLIIVTAAELEHVSLYCSPTSRSPEKVFNWSSLSLQSSSSVYQQWNLVLEKIVRSATLAKMLFPFCSSV